MIKEDPAAMMVFVQGQEHTSAVGTGNEGGKVLPMGTLK